MVEIIDFNQCCSREDRVRHLFLHHETEAILEFPLNLGWLEDKLVWNFKQMKFAQSNQVTRWV